jgi:hypothetical protein
VEEGITSALVASSCSFRSATKTCAGVSVKMGSLAKLLTMRDTRALSVTTYTSD